MIKNKIIFGFLSMMYGYEFAKYLNEVKSYNLFLSYEESPIYLSMLIISVCLTFIFFKKE